MTVFFLFLEPKSYNGSHIVIFFFSHFIILFSFVEKGLEPTLTHKGKRQSSCQRHLEYLTLLRKAVLEVHLHEQD